ncbi:flagellar hook-associated protein FlgK [Cellulomonas marina]|uniref:Flagellar hook-associated protein 1 n=1 Tax=Cellulomonas marina TaxID=988821 RepID=A0A1I0WJR2_9CELL|nr:flagellar hook-associated protein FlgK [Cellulomonas marina]GIG27678.1 flagellar hook-associated protein FlgK [Cellulomonas marina]SFA88468.1 flagellar hook-associated protein 1 FlgK [Cellulomonas marina]
MSTFSGISTALSSLVAQRQALDVTSQNVANANTVGYTRQRATLVASPTAINPSMFSTASGVGDGVRVTGVARLADAFLDAQVRSTTSGAAFHAVRATAYDTLETSLGELDTDSSLSAGMNDMWAAWGDLSNHTDQAATRTSVLDRSAAVVDRIGALYQGVRTQWTQARDQTVALVDQVNSTAATVADLNRRILSVQSLDGNANELMDQRDQAVTTLAGLVGATAQTGQNGTLSVLVGGNAIVEGSSARPVRLAGATSFAAATGAAAAVPPVAGDPVRLVWADRPTSTVGVTGGSVAGQLSVLAPPDPAGGGGVLTEAAARLDAVAATLAGQVNAVHRTGFTRTGAAGGDVFTFAAGQPPALGLRVAITDGALLAASGSADPAAALDGRVADAVAALSTSTTGPQARWTSAVVELGNRSASASARATVSEDARAAAAGQQTSNAAVDTDEETVNLMAYQRGYQAAARVLSTIDSVLDSLMNMAR